MNDVIGPESCNSYNMLKLTEHIFQQHPEGAVIDYYERTLYNHILSTVRPGTDGFVYYTSMSPARTAITRAISIASGAASAPGWKTTPSTAAPSTRAKARTSCW